MYTYRTHCEYLSQHTEGFAFSHLHGSGRAIREKVAGEDKNATKRDAARDHERQGDRRKLIERIKSLTRPEDSRLAQIS